MLAASSFDDILAITLFSVFSSVSIDSVLAKYPDPAKVAAKEAATKALQEAAASSSRLLEGAEDGTSVKKMIGMNVFYVVTGFICAMAIGQSMGCLFNCCAYTLKEQEEMEAMTDFEKGQEDQRITGHEEKLRFGKFLIMLAIAISTPLVCNAIHFEESKFIMIIFFGYFCN